MKEQKIKMWKQIKSEMGLAKIFYKEDEFEPIKTLAVEGKEIPVVKHSDYLHCQGMALAATAVFEGFENPILIVVDNYFDMLPLTAQDFFIQHEIGHIVNGDMNQSKEVLDKWTEDRKKCIIPECEFYADYYAANQLGFDVAINAMEFMIKNTDMYSGTKSEFRRRIKYLEDIERMKDDPTKEEQKEIIEEHLKKHEKDIKLIKVVSSPFVIITIAVASVFVGVAIICRGKNIFKSLKITNKKISSFIKRIK